MTNSGILSIQSTSETRNTIISLRSLPTMLFFSLLSGCSAPESGNFPPEGISVEQKTASMEKWSRSCALCHVNGEGGAPRVGDRENWQPRLEQGTEILLAHTFQGFNRMPPLGYCMDCSETDFAVLIDFMSGSGR